MGIVFRQSIKSTIAVFGGAALGALISFIGPNWVPATELGMSRTLVVQAVVCHVVAMLGANSVITIFTPRYPAGSKQQKVIITAGFLTPLLVCLLAAIPYFLCRNWIVGHFQLQDRPFIFRYYALLPVLVIIWSYMMLLDAYLISQHKIAVSSFAREVLQRIVNIVLMAAFVLGYIHFDGFMIGTTLTYLFPVAMMLLVSARTSSFGFSLQWRSIPIKEWRSLIHFSWYHLLTGLSMQLVGFVDALMLGPLDKSGVASVAVYSTAVFIATMLSMPYRAMAPAAFPVLNQAFIDNDMPRMKDFFRRSGINITIASLAVFALITCNLTGLAHWLPPAYGAVVPLTLILMLGRLIDVLTGLNSDVLSISSHYKFLFRLSALMLVLLVLFNRLLIPVYSFYGAAWGTTLALAIFNIGKMLFLYRRLGMQPFSAGTAKVLGICAVTVLAGYYLPHIGNVFADIAVRSTVICIVYGALILWLKPSADVQEYLQSIKTRKSLF